MPHRLTALVLVVAGALCFEASSSPVRRRHAMVVSQNEIASRVGADVMQQGGTVVDAVVATAFALAVTHPTAGNIGGGGFLVLRPASGRPIVYDFRETAPAAASPTMFMPGGRYDPALHHDSHVAVGVPGTVAGLHLAWQDHGKLPWPRLVEPAVVLARDGFVVTDGLATSLEGVLDDMKKHPASFAQFSNGGVPYQAGETLRQPDLARTLQRIADRGPAGFYEGETALLIENEMRANGGLITRDDLKAYRPTRRVPLLGTYRGYEIISAPPPSSGGTVLVEMLNILEGFDLQASGFGSARTIHVVSEAMRRAYADRARYLGDPEFNPRMPIDRLTSKAYAEELRKTIDLTRASTSSPARFSWPSEGQETTHVSAVDAARNAVAMTYTLEYAYGSRIVVPGAGFLLNNEMGDFNAGPGLTTQDGLIGTDPNLAQPGKRMLSSMTPTILMRDGRARMVTGAVGGRTIINSVLLTILNVVDFGMNAQDAVDAPRFHHQWLPDQILYEERGISPDSLAILAALGHQRRSVSRQGVAELIVVDPTDERLEGGVERRVPDGAAVGY